MKDKTTVLEKVRLFFIYSQSKPDYKNHRLCVIQDLVRSVYLDARLNYARNFISPFRIFTISCNKLHATILESLYLRSVIRTYFWYYKRRKTEVMMLNVILKSWNWMILYETLRDNKTNKKGINIWFYMMNGTLWYFMKGKNGATGWTRTSDPHHVKVVL